MNKLYLIPVLTILALVGLNNLPERQLITKSTTLFYSGHRGTINEMNFVYKRHHISHLSLTRNWYFLLSGIYGYENSITLDASLGNICNEYSLIIISDTIQASRPFFDRIKTNRCQTNFAFQLVDRFDRWVALKDKKKFIQSIKELSNQSNVFWLPNNDYEMFFLNNHGIQTSKENTFLLKPYGVIEIENNEESNTNKSVIYIHNDFNEPNFLKNFEMLDKNSYKIFTFGVYGGPLFLKKQKIFIYFPYQYSVMKVFDNAANGVFTAIPTAKFFKQIFIEYNQNFHLMPELLDLFETNPNNWTEYFDVYNKKYSEMYFKFDSWSQLYDIINNYDKNEIIKNRSHYLKKTNEIMKEHWTEVDNEWNRFFTRLNFK